MIKVTKRTMYSIAFFAVLATAIEGCYYDKGELLYPGSNNPVDCSTTGAKFSANVLPLITSKCAINGCHSSSSGRTVLTNYAQIRSAKDGILLRAVQEKTMPESAPLPDAEIAVLKCWIEAGAPNN